MALRLPQSLHLRLWAVIVLASLPVFLLAFADYRERRQDAITSLEREVERMLTAARMAEDAALRHVQQSFQIMARADNLQSLDPQDCSALAQRLLEALPNFADMGAALPNGEVFCSARPLNSSQPRTVAGEAWFRDALAGSTASSGQPHTDPLLHQAVLMFGYPAYDKQGKLLAVLYAMVPMDHFSWLLAGFNLPAGWNAFLLSDTGQVLSYHSAQGLSAPVDPEATAPFLQTLHQGRSMAELVGLDGHVRMYGIAQPRFVKTPMVMAMGAPVERTLAGIEKGFWLRMALLSALATACALLARYYVFGLIEAWTGRITQAVDQVAAGDLSTRLQQRSPVRELRQVEQGINHMTEELQRRQAELQRLSIAVEQSPVAILITDPQGRIEYVNQAFVHATGQVPGAVLGRTPHFLIPTDDPQQTLATMWATLQAGQIWRGTFGHTHQNGSARISGTTISPVVDDSGQVLHYVAALEDLTQRQQAEKQIHRLAYYDTLTGLPNRALLHERMGDVLHNAQQRPGSALLLFDIDHFRLINDTWGHAAGDQLLRAVALRILGHAPAPCTVARLGSNTFGVLAQDLGATPEQVSARAQALALAIHQTLTAPCALADGQRLYTTHSGGIALPAPSVHSPLQWLTQAEVALYRANGTGGNTVLLFDATMQAALDERASLEMALREAVQHQAFELHYQVQVNAQGTPIGAEALIRWNQGPGGKPVSPAGFIPLAEETGLIVPLGHWVLHTACAQLARWQAQPATRQLSMAVNVSARQFHQAEFVAGVGAAIAHYGIDPAGLKLELTESAILGDIDSTIARMQALRALGLRLSLDDFGTGYSSLSYLQRLPLDQIKIDQSFTRAMLAEPASSAIVRAILAMSQTLNLDVVAEGVETAEHHAFLVQHGCRFSQGYWFGRPLPIAAWEAAHVKSSQPLRP